jgi:hypothetical protein
MTARTKNNPSYCFIDIDLRSRQIIGWGTEKKDKVDVQLSTGYHRVFLSTGQFNKLEKKLKAASAQ